MESNKNIEVDQVLAAPTERLLAALIDLIPVLIISATGVGAILGIGYFLAKDSLPIFDGQSIGKKLLKIKVLNEDTSKTIVNQYEKSVVRNFTLLIPVFQLIDAFMVFSSDRKRFGDKWARTIVIKDV